MSVLILTCLVVGLSLANAVGYRSKRFDALEATAGYLLIAGLFLIGLNLPLFR